MEIKSLKYVIVTQSLLGNSRHWPVEKLENDQNWKRLFSLALWSMSSFILVFVFEPSMPYYEQQFNKALIRAANLFIIANTLLSMAWAYYTTAYFKKLLFYLSKTHKHLNRYTGYIRKATILNIIVGTILFSFTSITVFGFCVGIISLLTISNVTELNLKFFYVTLVHLAAQIRMGTEYLLFFCVLKWLSAQLEFITLNTQEIAERLKNTIASELNYKQYEKSLNVLFFTYMNTCESCSLINKIFSVPISTSLALTLLAHLAISYAMTTYTLKQGTTLYQLLMYALTLLSAMMAVVAMALAGQSIHNGADSVVRALAHLLQVTNVSDDALYHSVRRAVRAASGRTLRVKIFGSTEMGTAMLPTSLAFFTSYLVLALQFNNVL